MADVGVSLRMADMIDTLVSPLNGLSPVAISYRRMPRENTSERESTVVPCACSGDMYATVPRMRPAPVNGSVVIAAVRPSFGDSSRSFARPKSSTFTPPSGRI